MEAWVALAQEEPHLPLFTGFRLRRQEEGEEEEPLHGEAFLLREAGVGGAFSGLRSSGTGTPSAWPRLTARMATR